MNRPDVNTWVNTVSLFLINLKKSSLVPKQQIYYLGLEIDSVLNTAMLSMRRVEDSRRCQSQFHSVSDWVFSCVRSRWVLSMILNAAWHLHRQVTLVRSDAGSPRFVRWVRCLGNEPTLSESGGNVPRLAL